MHPNDFNTVKIIPPILLALLLLVQTRAASPSGFSSLFNGRDLAGWDGAEGIWRVSDGVLIGETTPEKVLKHHSYLIWRGGEIADFHLRLKFKLSPPANSGVQYRSKDLGDHDVRGYQCNLEASKPGRTGILEEMKNGRGGALAEAGERVHFTSDGKRDVTGKINELEAIERAIHRGEWNELEIIVRGNRHVHRINGTDVVEVIDDHPTKAVRQGILALQIHTGKPMRVEFKAIELQQLTP
jgi:hypothetical protein